LVGFGGRTAGGREAVIEALSIWQNVMAHFEQLEKLLLDEILVFANLIQIPAVILTGAWLGLFAGQYGAGPWPGYGGFRRVITSTGSCTTVLG